MSKRKEPSETVRAVRLRERLMARMSALMAKGRDLQAELDAVNDRIRALLAGGGEAKP